MAQEKLNGVSDDWKKQTKHISFQNSNSAPSFSDNILYIYNTVFEGEINLSQFPNLRRISFANNVTVNNLESIDISENKELSKIVLNESAALYPLRNSNCNLLIKERQLSQVVVMYHQLMYVNGTSVWLEKYKLLGQQELLPYVLIENGKKLEQLEAEIEKLNQAIAEKDQQIESLKKENEETPTLSQFQELVDIVFSPNTDLDFNKLKKEIKGLKLKFYLPHFQKEENTLKKLITDAKEKAGTNMGKFLDLLLQIQKQIFERQQENDSFAQGQLSAYQIILQEKLDYDELQKILTEQKKLLKLEQQLRFLQSDEEEIE
ncbi:uncharacterized protein OCT59_029282 [Rhizophagus irregularis]|uniref:Uncharacterized protein n=1 Tax=Rhizophagus irregularis (strain DAOM 181602 / DAOM 197198 / MUCL 43194) TaxID=747089 RepID=U9UEG3_RHIID|nr:hypothetical protein GLOIN_2v1655297 [Rhizophagus irregularis DAOM 181602=DAOM 197198]POG66652.1 hypothetical protein GLOIN_2v1655297 [Rhizophagus irregularis DAOM 181602=DAOM 197198]UZO09044.1 hypothetical protein OCT59_029282 [Rhizophagus irregularis]GET64960.1 hypothetical protein GLOIN_2v1655297 [Rhizophagus irregularis DAOM 181602=DAOM 197198]CAG8441502.1 2947_t:CDS:1 [Rhizophagus irregularis]|eukprot:XP_025173518.1 hypothetical protein GLOIN_2v1655297 [Rhizophagus irregularis DAOM 181602=DAOM 197198]